MIEAFPRIEPFPIHIGWDPREDEAYHVCVQSLLNHTSIPLRIYTIDERALRSQGLFWRPQRKRPAGGGIDIQDHKPYSTEFSFTRFLVPHLHHHGWCLFVDLDFMWRSDIVELLSRIDNQYAVMVVKHYHDPTDVLKMDGVPQTRYPRKNWSSLILWNCDHPANVKLSLQDVNRRAGSWLHGFEWLQDSEIGSLPESYNWLCGHSGPETEAKIVHFTQGIPTMPEHMFEPYAEEWREIYSGANAVTIGD